MPGEGKASYNDCDVLPTQLRHPELDSGSIHFSRKGKTLREKQTLIDSGSESGMTKNCHAEVAEPQPNRSTQDLECYPAFGSSASSRRGGRRILLNLIGGQTLNQVQGDKILKNLFTSKRVAFTLAEVLITLAIIGVVAAMTIPTLISDYQEKVTVTKLKKMYSMLSNAYQLYAVDNGYLSKSIDVSLDGAKEAANIFISHLKVSKDCSTDFEDCLDIMQHKYKTGTPAFITEQMLYAVTLSDGSSLMFRGSDGKTVGVDYLGLIYYDVNGNDGPNMWGRDLFQFHLYTNGIRPVGIDTDKECDTFDAGCALSSSLGYGCAAWVIHKGNMDYLKCPDELTWEDSKCPN